VQYVPTNSASATVLSQAKNAGEKINRRYVLFLVKIYVYFPVTYIIIRR
jgi:hypothetical protein